MTKSYLDKDGLSTLVNGIKTKTDEKLKPYAKNSDLNEVRNASIKEFKPAMAFSDGLTVINAVTNGGTNIEAVQVYNNLDGKYSNAALGAMQGKAIDDRLKKLEEGGGGSSDTPKYFTTTLLSTSWVQNNSTGYYDYTITRSDITENTYVDISMDLSNLAKINGGAVKSYNGGFIISTYEQPTDNVEVSIRYSPTVGV